MKRSLALAASSLALAISAPAIANDRHQCIDDACAMVSIFEQNEASGAPTPASVEAVRYGSWGFDIAGMDRSVKPGDDWFAFVNGAWARETKIPADRSSYGAFAVLRELSEARLRKLVESYPAGEPGTDQTKVSALYRAFMDEAAIERADALPLLARLGAVHTARNREDLARLMGRSIGGFGSSLFGPGVNDDAKQPDRYSLYLRQSGLGLGDRELYLDSKFAEQRNRYRQYVRQMLEMAGWPDPTRSADSIVALETKIAEAHWTRAESRNRDKTYNLMTRAELESIAPGFPWAAFLEAAGVGGAERAIVAQNSAFPKLARVFAEADLSTLRAWQAFHIADDIAPLLSRRFVDANFEFRQKFLNGQPMQRDRWVGSSRVDLQACKLEYSIVSPK